ncbi:fasciclin domain-containing protein [Sphingomicrobium marinum]|uniref:fasciclin domain-containing protein n=1 Tax=Sphingomicrobium marinum TaxID=1227950 RepID=UPI002240D979|nr:fasciclin domain-containing protein [Sphingomicrobium marinum]
MKKTIIALMASSSLALGACGDTGDDTMVENETAVEETSMMEEEAGTIVSVAQGNEDFSTLVTAVQAGGLVETLSGEGPFTVFAPTNDAFAKLPEGTLETLTAAENQAQLAGILTYHVVAGETMSGDLITLLEEAGEEGVELTTVSGGTLTANLVDGNLVLTDANGGTATVVTTDVDASNGVIHVIDTVLMPAS